MRTKKPPRWRGLERLLRLNPRGGQTAGLGPFGSRWVINADGFLGLGQKCVPLHLHVFHLVIKANTPSYFKLTFCNRVSFDSVHPFNKVLLNCYHFNYTIFSFLLLHLFEQFEQLLFELHHLGLGNAEALGDGGIVVFVVERVDIGDELGMGLNRLAGHLIAHIAEVGFALQLGGDGALKLLVVIVVASGAEARLALAVPVADAVADFGLGDLDELGAELPCGVPMPFASHECGEALVGKDIEGVAAHGVEREGALVEVEAAMDDLPVHPPRESFESVIFLVGGDGRESPPLVCC